MWLPIISCQCNGVAFVGKLLAFDRARLHFVGRDSREKQILLSELSFRLHWNHLAVGWWGL